MGRGVSRREFVKAGAAVSAVAASSRAVTAQSPTVLVRKATPPVVIASANGHQFKNGGERTCVEEAFARITAGDTCRITGFHVWEGNTNPPNGSNGIELNQVSGVVVKDCYIRGADWGIVMQDTATNNRVDGCTIAANNDW